LQCATAVATEKAGYCPLIYGNIKENIVKELLSLLTTIEVMKIHHIQSDFPCV
jgi:hypothetical protein